jgi:hypothetical protein
LTWKIRRKGCARAVARPGASETDYEVQQQDETGSPVRVQIITPSFTTQQHESTTVPVFVQTI